jgi:hypothetical protein
MKVLKIELQRLTILLNLFLIVSINQVMAIETVTHDFEGSIDEWVIQSWKKSVDGAIPIKDSPGFTVQDGILRAPNSADLDTYEVAYTNSSVAYGTWEFDWFIRFWSFDIVPFIFNDLVNNYNQTGLTEDEWIKNCTGYGLFMQDFDEISLISYYHYANDLEPFLATHFFSQSLSPGVHKIKVTRNYDGVFLVYLNSELIMRATDNNVTTSSVFHINSFQGDSGFDNITISSAVIPTTTTTNTPSFELVTSLLIVGIVLKYRKNKK